VRFYVDRSARGRKHPQAKRPILGPHIPIDHIQQLFNIKSCYRMIQAIFNMFII